MQVYACIRMCMHMHTYIHIRKGLCCETSSLTVKHHVRSSSAKRAVTVTGQGPATCGGFPKFGAPFLNALRIRTVVYCGSTLRPLIFGIPQVKSRRPWKKKRQPILQDSLEQLLGASTIKAGCVPPEESICLNGTPAAGVDCTDDYIMHFPHSAP